MRAERTWTKKVPGLLTDLGFSANGATIVVATIPDPDALDPRANRKDHDLVFYSASDGKTLAVVPMPAQVKSLSLSSDGAMTVVSTYDDAIRAYDRKGTRLWETEGFCKPIVLSLSKRILCFHDDDEEPDLGFDVFSWKGERISSFPIRSDALTMKAETDERFFILALTRGKVLVFDKRFQIAFRKTVPGEIVDVAIADGKFAVLYEKKNLTGQKLTLFGERGKEKSIPVPRHIDQIELSPDGKSLFGYSDSHGEQALLKFAGEGSPAWNASLPQSAEYSSPLQIDADTAWAGFQESGSSNAAAAKAAVSDSSHILGFDFSGGLKTAINVPSEESSFLYAFSIAPAAREIAVASDDGKLSLFRLK